MSESGFPAYDLVAPSKLIFPRLTPLGPKPVSWWGQKYDGPDRPPRPDGWSLKRRHAHLVRKRICHYDDGDVHTGTLHCFCGLHRQAVAPAASLVS